MTDLARVWCDWDSNERFVLPFKNHQADQGILVRWDVVWLVEGYEDERVDAATPAFSAVHARTLLAILVLLVLRITSVGDYAFGDADRTKLASFAIVSPSCNSRTAHIRIHRCMVPGGRHRCSLGGTRKSCRQKSEGMTGVCDSSRFIRSLSWASGALAVSGEVRVRDAQAEPTEDLPRSDASSCFCSPQPRLSHIVSDHVWRYIDMTSFADLVPDHDSSHAAKTLCVNRPSI